MFTRTNTSSTDKSSTRARTSSPITTATQRLNYYLTHKVESKLDVSHLYALVQDSLTQRLKKYLSSITPESYTPSNLLSALRDSLQGICHDQTHIPDKPVIRLLRVELQFKLPSDELKNGEIRIFKNYVTILIYLDKSCIPPTLDSLQANISRGSIKNWYPLHTIARTFVHEFTHYLQSERSNNRNQNKLKLNPTQFKELVRVANIPDSVRRDHLNSGLQFGKAIEVESHATNVVADLLRKADGDPVRALKFFKFYLANPFKIPTDTSLYTYRFNLRRNPLFPQVWPVFCKKVYQHLISVTPKLQES